MTLSRRRLFGLAAAAAVAPALPKPSPVRTLRTYVIPAGALKTGVRFRLVGGRLYAQGLEYGTSPARPFQVRS